MSSAELHRVAALDLGSNSLHLVICDVDADGELTRVEREKDVLRLGEVVARHGELTPEAVDRLLTSLQHMAKVINDSDVDDTVVCATAALREAANRDAVIERIAAETGLEVGVIDGREEAALIFEAVRASVRIDPAPALCLDLGGGSLELAIGDKQGLEWVESVPLGVGRLTAELVENDPLTDADVQRITHRVTDLLTPLVVAVGRHRPRLLVATSGTALCLARMGAQRRDGQTFDGEAQLTRTELAAIRAELVTSDLDARRDMPGIDKRRADTMPAGAIILETAMALFGFELLVAGPWALREGMVLDAVHRSRSADGYESISVRTPDTNGRTSSAGNG